MTFKCSFSGTSSLQLKSHLPLYISISAQDTAEIYTDICTFLSCGFF